MTCCGFGLKMSSLYFSFCENIFLRGPHPPPSPEERGPILRTEKFTFIKEKYYLKTTPFLERERPPLLWRGARGEAFRRFCLRSRLDFVRVTQGDVPVLRVGGGIGPRSGPIPPPLYSRQAVILRKAQHALCAGPIRRTVLTLCTKRIVCNLFLFLQTPNSNW
jgi:hypothetical protein